MMSEYVYAQLVLGLSKTKRKAFAILCADRCVRIFDYNFAEGAVELSNGVLIAMNNLWSNKINRPEIEMAMANLEAAIPILDDVGSQHGCAVSSGVAVLYALEAMISNSDEDVLMAASSALEAVDGFSEYTGEGLQEEESWQRHLLIELQKLPEQFDVTVLREMLNCEHPSWESLWL